MLKLLAEVDEFLLENTIFNCESSESAMIYSYINYDIEVIKIIIHTLQNKNLWIIIEKDETMHVIKDEFTNFEQFKTFIVAEFNEYLL